MKKTLIALSFLLFLYSCNDQNANCTTSTAQNEAASPTDPSTPTACPPPASGDGTVSLPPDTTPVEGDVPLYAAQFSAQVAFTNFSSADMDKVQAALELIQRVVRSKEFRNRVIGHSYQGVQQFVDNNGLTNEQIYTKLLEGSEQLTPGVDYQMDLELELYANYSTSTVGYTNPNTLRIWMNRKFFDQYVPEEVARNVFHEWTHKLGFDHDSRSTARRPYSVPYGVGQIIQDLAFKL
ncbi:MAG: hypothetical protein K2P81_11445 [Bacteriovoracaceae bacterium]|nr:hypothetical protein [Bacteriovoracaceae bacterium]